LEGVFSGAGWNVIKVIWGSYWDPLLAKDTKGLLRQRMEEALDGDYQGYKAHGGAYTREHFFGKYPELKEMVATMSDQDIWRLNRGGHDPHKIFAAYAAAMAHEGQPTVILAKTVKGYGMGEAGEAQNITHQQKKMDTDSIRDFRDRFNVPIADEDLDEVPYFLPADDSPEMQYLKERRAALGGSLPRRDYYDPEPLPTPDLSKFESITKDSGDREMSTTMAFVRTLSVLLRDKTLSSRIVPILCDEARTFGMEGMFRQLGIYSSVGQLYEPQDSDQLLYYKEDRKGQILQEGITEAGAMSSWIAAATSYSSTGIQMIPFYIYYSMFGFQRIGDLAWAAGDMRARGFLLGATSGRTTLNGEGLQHEDGHSHLLAGAIPNCVSYDPTYAYEVVVLLADGMRRMYAEQEDVFYYITLTNENYPQPGLPDGAEEGIRKGLYRLKEGGKGKLRAQLLGSGTILRECLAAADLLAADFDIHCDVWSATSFNELRREGVATTRHNRLNPAGKPQKTYVAQCLDDTAGPVIAATDYVRAYADQIREFVPRDYHVLGTDGFGRSDTRAQLRAFFEVDRYHVAYTTVHALHAAGEVPKRTLTAARKKYAIDGDKPNPVTV
ncbi:MAG: pyruvate dehydrogenase (acetyl-transferring), homodimeric type, partial [Pseudomonadota bacterium]